MGLEDDEKVPLRNEVTRWSNRKFKPLWQVSPSSGLTKPPSQEKQRCVLPKARVSRVGGGQGETTSHPQRSLTSSFLFFSAGVL